MATTPPPDKQPAAETLEKIAHRITAPFFDGSQLPTRFAAYSAILSALRNERERCAKVADRWANARSCTVHDNEPCCHIRTGARIAATIREGK